MINTSYPEDKFSQYCFIALGVHIGLVLIVIVINEIMGWTFFQSKNSQLELIQSSVRVDIVEMPKFTVQELKQMKVEPAPVAEEKVESPVNEEKEAAEPESKVDLSNILNSLSKKEVKQRPAKKIQGKVVDKTAIKKLILEGNKVSKGASAVGDSYAQEQTQFNSYIANLPDYVRPNWKLPSYLLERAELNCRIKIFIDSSGKIVRAEILSSSGVSEYDQKALQAIRSTGNLPPPPQEILSKVVSGKVVLGFPL